MTREARRSGVSPAQYLIWEREQAERHEYFRGEVFAMAGGSVRHNALGAALMRELGTLLPRSCHVLSSDQRIGLGAGERYVYPDVSVVCGSVTIEAGTTDVVENPTILVEVLSGSTESYDRGLKWEGYQRLASLTDYVLVSQAEARLEHFQRAPSGTWLYRAAGAGESLTLSQGVTLSVDAVFQGTLDLPGD